MSSLSPQKIAAHLEQSVIGQKRAVRGVAVAIAKKLAGLNAGNVLLIGSSGSGKTTLMRAVENYLASDEKLSRGATQIRVHANVLAHDAVDGAPGETLLHRLHTRAVEQLGHDADLDKLLDRVCNGIVFVDEIDKIRSRVGGEANVTGIRAQEALLTLMENERLPFRLPDSTQTHLDTRGILFVGAGAFEGLFDAVYDRVTVGEDRGALQTVTVLGQDNVREETRFALADWLRSRDLFEYGMTPQFLSRFDGVVLLQDLKEGELLEIFLGSPDSPLVSAKRFFTSFGIELALSPEAARAIAQAASLEPRLGARALKEVFRRVIERYEFEPEKYAADGALLLDRAEVEEALGAG